MPSYTEDTLAAALNTVNSGIPLRRAARDFGIPLTTLYDRRTNRQSKTTAYISQQKLSPIQENRLAEWIRIQDVLSLAPTHTQIRTFANRILLTGSSTADIGKHWLEGFLRRNPSVRTFQTRCIDTVRINGT